MPRFHHVSSVRNRDSIRAHGLDWTRMRAASGIAGSRAPEVEGCFLCVDPGDAEWFAGMNNTGGPVDVWAVDGIVLDQLEVSPEGYNYFPGKIPPHLLTLIRQDIAWTRERPSAGWLALDDPAAAERQPQRESASPARRRGAKSGRPAKRGRSDSGH